MKPGPTFVRSCQSCGKYISQDTLGSGNTAGARYWTDGKCLAPMLPEYLIWVKCPHCGCLLWIYDQKVTGVVKSELWPDEYFKPDLARLYSDDAFYLDGHNESYIRDLIPLYNRARGSAAIDSILPMAKLIADNLYQDKCSQETILTFRVQLYGAIDAIRADFKKVKLIPNRNISI